MSKIVIMLLVCLGFTCPVFSASNDLSIVTVSDMVVVQKANSYEGRRPTEVFDTTNKLRLAFVEQKSVFAPYDYRSWRNSVRLWNEPTDNLIPLRGISGSGISTRYGIIQPALHFATIRSASTGKEVKLYVQVASTDGKFNRSGFFCEGDLLPGAGYGYAGMAGRRREKEKRGEMSALIEVVFPEQKEAFVVFVGYDTTGALIPAFSTTGFERHTQLVENWRNHGP